MKLSIDTKDLEGYSHTVTFDEINECPICHTVIKPQILYSILFNETAGAEEERLFNFSILNLCLACNHSFMAEYLANDDHELDSELYAETLIHLGPSVFQQNAFDPNIERISPSFTKIYNQASQAELMSMNEIAGIAYRKAVEFLVKDYAIYICPADASKIKKYALGDCIDQYISDSTVTALAKSATWLGNDQTHYVKKHHDKDISHLKKFMEALQYFICMHEVAKEATSFTKR